MKTITLNDEILLRVKKPARYIGNEFNMIKKDLSMVDVTFALCFPDLYEVGMSYLGFKILYGIINSLDRVACERAFAPAADMEEIMRAQNMPLFSLESKMPLSDFDLIGFSLGYEMNYTNALNMMELSGIPLRASDRDDRFGIIIAGGPCVFNPEPMSDFIDVFVIGDGEDVIVEIVQLIKETKTSSSGFLSKKDILNCLSRIEGVYVPSLYNVDYNCDGRINEFKPIRRDIPKIIKKRVVKDLDSSYYPTSPIVPYIEVIHDRISIELMRGCGNGCKFCQANMLYGPRRLRSKEQVLKLVNETYKNTGYNQVSLLSLSSLGHPDIVEIAQALISNFKDKGVSVSLPSLRANSLLLKILPLIVKVTKTGLTFAPEAGSERLRKLIHKDINMDILLDSVEMALELGWRRIKLYFMIGLPTETDQDLDGIVDFIRKIIDIVKKKRRYLSINISVSNFIPKPHTAFERYAMEPQDKLIEKQLYLRNRLQNKCLKLKFHDVNLSYIEALFSQGDRRLGQLIYLAYKMGARFDGWRDLFQYGIWLKAIEELQIDKDIYLTNKDENQILSWSHIDPIVV